MATPKECMDQAMARRRPDRIPMMCQLANGHTIINTGVHPIDYFTSDEVWTDCLLKIRADYDFDGILCHKPGRVQGLMDQVVKTDYDAETPSFHFDDGSYMECTRDDDMYYKKGPEFEFPTIETIDVEHPLDWAPETYQLFQASKGTFDYNTPEEIPDHVFGTLDRLVAAVGDEYSVHGEVRAPFDHFMNLIGMEPGLMALLDDPEKSRQLLERTTQWSIALAVAEVRRGAHAIKISSPFAGMGFLSKAMYADFIQPFETKLAEAVTAEGAYIYTHTCGAIGDRLDLIAECGVSGIECLDPPPLGNVDLEEAVEELNGELFIKGNIDPVNTLLRGDTEKIKVDVSEILETAGHQMDGFILSSACSVAPPTPPDNLKQAVGICQQFKP